MKILIIEDELNIRSNLKEILEIKGFEAITASDGPEGIEMAKKHLPDIILCDIKMPGKDGYQVKKELSNNDNTVSIPFIYLTAKAEITDIKYGMKLGADDYLIKPIKAAELVDSIENRIKRVEELRRNKPAEKKEKKRKAEKDFILLERNGKPELVNISGISLITSNGNYSEVYTSEGKKYFVRKLLKAWEELLSESVFLRVHRKYIININFVTDIEKWFKRSLRVKITGYTEPIMVSERYAVKIKSELKI